MVDVAGVVLRVCATPGHTADSVSFVLERSAVLTGDTVLGRGTTVMAHPDGRLDDYLASLRALESSATRRCCPVTVRCWPWPARPPTTT